MSKLFANFKFYLRTVNETLYSSIQHPPPPFEFVMLSSVRKEAKQKIFNLISIDNIFFFIKSYRANGRKSLHQNLENGWRQSLLKNRQQLGWLSTDCHCVSQVFDSAVYLTASKQFLAKLYLNNVTY